MRGINLRHDDRKSLLFWVLLLMGVLGLSSAAYACTIFKGTGTLRGHAQDPATGKKSSITVVGNNRNMSYCGDLTGFGFLPPGTGHTFVDHTTQVANADISVAPSVGTVHNPATGSTCDSALPDYTYDINVFNGYGWDNTNDSARFWNVDCMFNQANGGPGVTVGTMSVAGGVGSATVDLASAGPLVANSPNEESAICVSDEGVLPGPPLGIHMPITVL